MERVENYHIAYQIFPDRFHIGKGLSIHEKNEQKLYHDIAVLKEWNDPVTDDYGHWHSYYGGDLEGIIEKISYFINLGVNLIYLNPIYVSPTSHNFDVVNHRKVDPAFGDLEVFDRLVESLHRAHIQLILDLPLNHISSYHPYFRAAQGDTDSPFRCYFKFMKNTSEYECWRGNKTFPELNWQNPDVLREMITNEDSVLQFWVDRGIDGIRLDTANDLGLELCRQIRQHAKKLNPNLMIIGEVTCYSSQWLEVLDGTQSYFLTRSIHSVLNAEINTHQFSQNIRTWYSEVSLDRALNCFLALSSHDLERTWNALNQSKERLFQAMTFQFTLPGTPIIYYGDEIGMIGKGDPFNRAPMIWDETKWNRSILDYQKKIIQIRQQRAELQFGKIRDLTEFCSPGLISYLRYCPNDKKQFSITALNVSGQNVSSTLFIPYSFIYSGLKLKNLLGSQTLEAENGAISFQLESNESMILVPELDQYSNYNFFKSQLD